MKGPRKGNRQCEVCNKSIPEGSFDQHLKGSPHIRNLRVWNMDGTTPSAISGGHCGLCDIPVPKKCLFRCCGLKPSLEGGGDWRKGGLMFLVFLVRWKTAPKAPRNFSSFRHFSIKNFPVVCTKLSLFSKK